MRRGLHARRRFLSSEGARIAVAVLAAVGAAGVVGAVAESGTISQPSVTLTAPAQLGLFDDTQTQSAVESDAQALGVTVGAITVYASGGVCYCTYSPITTGLRLVLGVGALTPGQATTIAQALVASGHGNTVVRIMWEMNQDVSGWFQDWNQSTFPNPASYVSTFQAIVTAMRSVPGADFTFMWNPNGGSGNEAAGRTWNDTYPGDAYVDEIGIDQYDFSGYQANFAQVQAFAVAHGKPFGIPEWGLNGSDDPAYVNFVASLQDVALNAYFIYAGNPNSNIFEFPKSQAAYTADFGSSGPPSTTTTTTTRPPSTTTTTRPKPPPTTTTTRPAPPTTTTTTVPPVTGGTTTTTSPVPPPQDVIVCGIMAFADGSLSSPATELLIELGLIHVVTDVGSLEATCA